MEKASKAIRRSGVRLRSLSSGHGDLQMVISQLGEVRSTFKAFALAQSTAAEDLLRWAGGSSSGGGQENRAIEETFAHLAELSVLWSEVQKDFSDQLKEYRTQYELILEGEKHVTDAREVLSIREQREGKLRRDLKRASKKAPLDEICMLKEKLGQAERSRDLAHLDVVERVGENEAVKMIRVKEGLLKLGAAYYELAHKCLVIFSAHRDIALQLPDVHDRDLHGVKYTGAGSAMRCVQEAKEKVRAFRRSSTSPPKPPPPHPSEPPPPYTPSADHLPTHRYPPTAPVHPHSITHSPSLPEDHTPPCPPQASPHSNSAPNLVEDTPPAPHTLPPLSTHERSSFTDTAYRPDTSASSPDLAYPPHPIPPTEQPLPSTPYNPYYEWLPGRGRADQETDGRHGGTSMNLVVSAGTQTHGERHHTMNGPSGKMANCSNSTTTTGTSTTNHGGDTGTAGTHSALNGLPDSAPTPVTGRLPAASVRPRVGRNPFWDSEEEGGGEEEEEEEEREETGVGSLSGALRKTAIR